MRKDERETNGGKHGAPLFPMDEPEKPTPHCSLRTPPLTAAHFSARTVWGYEARSSLCNIHKSVGVYHCLISVGVNSCHTAGGSSDNWMVGEVKMINKQITTRIEDLSTVSVKDLCISRLSTVDVCKSEISARSCCSCVLLNEKVCSLRQQVTGGF